MTETAVAEATKAGRLPNGRFRPGRPGGPGNPLGRRIEQLRHALARAVTREDVEAIARRLVVAARRGDIHAAHEVFDRLLGKPLQPVDLSGFIAVTHSAIIAAAFNGGFPRESRIDEALRIAESAPLEVAAEVDSDGH